MKKKLWKDYFQSQSPRITKIVNGLFSPTILLFIAVLIIGTIHVVCVAVSESGMDITSKTGFVVIRDLFVVLLVLFVLFSVAFFSAVYYNYLTIKDKTAEEKEVAKVNSPFIGRAVEHEKEIVDILKSVAKPLPSKDSINQAKTAKFIIALSDLELIDSNLDNRNILAWVANVTGYKTGETRVFNQAKKAVKVNDLDLINYKSQIEEILSK